jgi:hypothetical protein
MKKVDALTENIRRYVTRLFRGRQAQPLIAAPQGTSATKKGCGVPHKTLKERRKALQLRQKQARQVQRRGRRS